MNFPLPPEAAAPLDPLPSTKPLLPTANKMCCQMLLPLTRISNRKQKPHRAQWKFCGTSPCNLAQIPYIYTHTHTHTHTMYICIYNSAYVFPVVYCGPERETPTYDTQSVLLLKVATAASYERLKYCVGIFWCDYNPLVFLVQCFPTSFPWRNPNNTFSFPEELLQTKKVAGQKKLIAGMLCVATGHAAH
jgi:hypothetical protein